MLDALEEKDRKVRNAGKFITSLQSVNDTESLDKKQQESHLQKVSNGDEKTKLMTNSANNIYREIEVKGWQKVLKSFK